MIDDFRPGKILNEAVSLYSRGFAVLFPLTMLCFLPYIGVSLYEATQTPAGAEDLESDLERLRSSALSNLLSTISQTLATGALSFAVYRMLQGKPASVGGSFAVGVRRFLPLLGAAIASGLFVMLGFLLLFVPGLIFATMVFVVSPACVVERLGVFGAMQRSRELSKGYRWKILVLVLLEVVAIFGLGMLTGFVHEIVPNDLGGAAIMVFAEVLVMGQFATAAAVAYYHLRSIKESVDIEDVALAFE